MISSSWKNSSLWPLRNPGQKNRRGMTLMEVLISLLLMAIVLAGGMPIFTHAHRLQTLAVHKRLAAEAANSTLEEIKTASDLTPGAFQSIVDWGEFQGEKTVTVTELSSLQLNDPIFMQAPAGSKAIQVTVSWQEAGQNRPSTVELMTYVAPD